jgi:DNA-binding transcriptional LysR family regulator
MELRHLRYFVAIAEEKSFTRAAERLWIAQPGLSTQIRRLEAELEIQLFVRHTRGVELTDGGQIFLERARAALAAAETARATGHDLESGLVGSVRLGIATGPWWHLTATLLEAYGEDHRHVEVTVFESHGGALVRDLRDGRLDALLAPAIFGSPELFRLEVGREPWAVLVGPGHRLAQPRPVGACDLVGEEFVVTGHRDGAGYDRAVSETLVGLGLAPVLRRGGPGPAFFSAVIEGEALALGTAPSNDLVARPLRPARQLAFELLWRDEIPGPALAELIRVAGAFADSAPPERQQLLAVPA